MKEHKFTNIVLEDITTDEFRSWLYRHEEGDEQHILFDGGSAVHVCINEEDNTIDFIPIHPSKDDTDTIDYENDEGWIRLEDLRSPTHMELSNRITEEANNMQCVPHITINGSNKIKLYRSNHTIEITS